MIKSSILFTNQRQLRVCFVINDFDVSPQVIAAEWLAHAGHLVSILFIQSRAFDVAFIQKWQSYYNKKSIRLIPFSYQGPLISSLLTAVHSYHILHWMLENALQFDIVHFPLFRGLAYYTLLAKHQGWAFQQIQFCLDLDSSTLWDKHIHKLWVDQVEDLAADFLERESVRLADMLINFGIHDLLDWMKKQEWQFLASIQIFSEMSLQSSETQAAWLSLHEEMSGKECSFQSIQQGEDRPLVSVCLTHFNRPHYLAQALESIRAQTYSNFEVILVDDASTLPEAQAYLDSLNEEFAAKGWQMIRNQTNLFPGAARNLAARQSRGEYLLFMDDDNYAKPDQIQIFVQVARRVGADILTCAMDVFGGHSNPSQNTVLIHRFLPLGAAVGVGLYLNIFGDMNALIKKTVYDALNGLTEDRGIGGEDWELFARAVLKGYRLETIPLALFWYRDSLHSVTKTTSLNENYLRAIRSYLDAVPSALRENIVLSQAQQEKLSKLTRDYNSLREVLKRCWQLFSSRAWRAICHPRKSIKKVAKRLFSKGSCKIHT